MRHAPPGNNDGRRITCKYRERGSGVEKMFENLKLHKASGPDGITPQILKRLAKTIIAPTFCNIFNKSYDTIQKFQMTGGKHNYVVPIYKKGDRTDPINYRPVSLTCIACIN